MIRTKRFNCLAERLTCVHRVREVWSSNPGPAISYTALQMVHQRFNIYADSCVALALWRGDEHRKLVTRFSNMASITKGLVFLILHHVTLQEQVLFV